MIGLGIANSLGVNLSGINPAAKSFVSATGISNPNEVKAINDLVNGLQADGIWSKMKAVYPFVTDNRNRLDYTEDFSNAVWAKNGSTVTTNTITAPNGTLTADTLSDGTANATHVISTFKTSFGQNGNNTSTIYAKANTLNYLWMYFYNGSEPAGIAAFFNLSNGTVGTVQSGLTASIENAGNGWYRCSITRNFNFTAANSNCGFGVSNADNVFTYLGTNKSVYIWGAQLDEAVTATTYQPITTTQQAYIASQFKYNLVNPLDTDAAFRLVFNGGWTHSVNGATPNGTNGYADTKFVPNTQLTLNSASFSAYSRNNFTPIIDQSWGCSSNSSNLPLFAQSFDPTKYIRSFIYSYLTPDAMISATGIDFSGLFTTTRTAANNAKSFRNTTQLAAVTTQAQTTQPTNNFFFGAFNGGTGISNYSNFQYAFSHIGDGLTDTDAANLYTRVQTFNQALGRQVGVPIVSDADAQAFLNSAEITDLTQANAINTLVTDLKAQGLWTKMKAVYPFVGGTASTHKWNLKDPRDLDAAYRLVFNGGWTHSSTGATPNGTNGFADTKLSPFTKLSQSSAHNAHYFRSSLNTNSTGYGVVKSDYTERMDLIRFTDILYSAIGNQGQTSTSSIPYNSLICTSRTSLTSNKLYKAGILLDTKTDLLVSNLPNFNYYLAAVNQSGFTNLYTSNQLAFSSIGDGLTDTEAAALNSAVQTYQTTLNRNV
jgi:hypothetical protein